jgi:hypothetical protein
MVRQGIVAVRGRPEVGIGRREETCRRAWVLIFGHLAAGDGAAATTNACGEEQAALNTASHSVSYPRTESPPHQHYTASQ